MAYILALTISLCLIAGQSLWASSVKSITTSDPSIASISLLQKLAVSPKVWLGALAYLLGTACYFLLLSKVKFFSIQLTMTGLAIVFSVLVAHFLFKESITLQNSIGIILILVGIVLVFNR